MSRKRQSQIKQMWFNAEDEERFERLAKEFVAEGHDMEPDIKTATSPYSHTKVMRHAMKELEELRRKIKGLTT